MAGFSAFVVVVCGWWSPSGLGRRCLYVRPPAAPAHCVPWSVPRTARTAKHEGRECREFVELECTGDQRLANFLRKAMPGARGGVVAGSEQVELLIHLGAVHVRKCKENKKGRRMLPWSRRLEDGQIRKGSLVRVYTRPARFPVDDVDWRSRVLFEDGDYLIVDKPAGIPYQATRSNFRECLVQALTSALGFKVWGLHRSRSSSLPPLYSPHSFTATLRPLPPGRPETQHAAALRHNTLLANFFPTTFGSFTPSHRLDLQVSGCIAFAKSKRAAAHFHQLLGHAEDQNSVEGSAG